MKDIENSLQRAMVEQGWIFGDKVTRIGSPFEWTENEQKSNILDARGLLAVAFYYSMFYVKRATPDAITVPEHDEIFSYCYKVMTDSFKHFFPFLSFPGTWQNHVESQALARTQDCCFIKRYCADLPAVTHHMDVGAGLGSSGIYSLKFFNSVFYPVEAHPMSYSVQRDFLRFISPAPGAYLDVVECESYQLSREQISTELTEKESYRIRHLPSWRFPLVPQGTIDLVTATFVLNELNYAGILWILAQVSRVLHKGGYFYIRDSFILKPGMHNIAYDEVLLKIGFERRAQFEIANRLDFFGIPRLFQKTTDDFRTFDEMVDLCLGKFASVASGGGKAYNLETVPKK